MSGPSLSDLRAHDGEVVQVVVPKPREDQRLVGEVAVGEDGVRLRLDDPAGGERFGTVRFRERDGDGVVQALRPDGALIGRVTSVTAREG